MGLQDNYILASLYENIDVLIIILIRVLGFVIMLPVFSGINIPKIIKLMFSLVSAALIYSTGLITVSVTDANVFSYGYLLLKEFVVGVSIAFIAYLFFTIVYIMGQFIDFQLGLSMASVFDPVSQIQVPITGNLFYFILLLLFVQSGGLHSFIGIIINSYNFIPAGEANIEISKDIIIFIVNIVVKVFEASVRFSLPMIATITMIDIGLGILVKAVPQMNVFVVGVPIKVLVGFIVLILITPMTLGIYDYIFNSSYRNMMDFIKGMS